VLVFIGISDVALALLVVLLAWLHCALANVLIGDIPARDSWRCRIAAILAAHPFPGTGVLAEAEQKQRLEIDFARIGRRRRSSSVVTTT